MSAGSGVIVDADKGLILTNRHIVADASEISVTLRDRRRFKTELVGNDQATDVALLRIKASRLTALPFGNSDALRVCDTVVAIGNPFGLGITASATDPDAGSTVTYSINDSRFALNASSGVITRSANGTLARSTSRPSRRSI
ncbi:trypsin-like peptidase domain-containing protein [Mesorhizobium sp. M0047]|uniref:S1C family serine protease n=1 Tax=Mesorhizobium sp. M0047 TaxID=2956859 RepID=UPI003338E042